MRKLMTSLGLTCAIIGGILSSAPLAIASGQQSCLSGDTCISWYSSGSTYDGFATGNLGNLNYYTFNNAVVVGNNAGYGRDRISVYPAICFWANPAGGLVVYAGIARYTGYSWELISKTTESFTSSLSTSCIY
jgi:hypothetical protein